VNKGGRPRKIDSPERFEELADAYFSQCVADERRPTVNGLCLALGLYDRGALDDYASYDGFSHVVKKARMRLESAWEGALAAPQVAGAIFWLKNQGWKDTQDIHHGGSVVHEVMLVGPSDHGQG
jgi:hypothetical protein